jgi:hypothetical protein
MTCACGVGACPNLRSGIGVLMDFTCCVHQSRVLSKFEPGRLSPGLEFAAKQVESADVALKAGGGVIVDAGPVDVRMGVCTSDSMIKRPTSLRASGLPASSLHDNPTWTRLGLGFRHSALSADVGVCSGPSGIARPLSRCSTALLKPCSSQVFLNHMPSGVCRVTPSNRVASSWVFSSPCE